MAGKDWRKLFKRTNADALEKDYEALLTVVCDYLRAHGYEDIARRCANRPDTGNLSRIVNEGRRPAVKTLVKVYRAICDSLDEG